MAKPAFRNRQSTWDPSTTSITALEQALGYTASQDSHKTAHIKFILSHTPAHDEGFTDYVDLVTDAVKYFNGPTDQARSVRAFVETILTNKPNIYFGRYRPQKEREKAIWEVTWIILGVMVFMKGYFKCPATTKRRILLAYSQNLNETYAEEHCNGVGAVDKDLPELLRASGLLPSEAENENVDRGNLGGYAYGANESEVSFGLHAPTDTTESLVIEATALSAAKLATIGGVQIHWTDNISRHLLLSKHGRSHRLELFCLPYLFRGHARPVFQTLGLDNELMSEIEDSYGALFNPAKSPHGLLGKLCAITRWCHCCSCASKRFRDAELKKMKSHYYIDSDLMKKVLEKPVHEWDQVELPRLWPRIRVLEAYLSNAKPWSFWVIFRDRRDTVQFWTFLFGSFVLILAVIQVLLAAAQVAGSFI